MYNLTCIRILLKVELYLNGGGLAPATDDGDLDRRGPDVDAEGVLVWLNCNH